MMGSTHVGLGSNRLSELSSVVGEEHGCRILGVYRATRCCSGSIFLVVEGTKKCGFLALQRRRHT